MGGEIRWVYRGVVRPSDRCCTAKSVARVGGWEGGLTWKGACFPYLLAQVGTFCGSATVAIAAIFRNAPSANGSHQQFPRGRYRLTRTEGREHLHVIWESRVH
jgi:hypothetical protein